MVIFHSQAGSPSRKGWRSEIISTEATCRPKNFPTLHRAEVSMSTATAPFSRQSCSL